MNQDRMNVVLLVTHDTGRHVGAYGIQTVTTPNADALARDGVLFANAFCTAPQCSPSRAAMLTGQYPHQTGVMGLSHGYEERSEEFFGWDLVEPRRHASHLFRDAGYHTGLLGFQHETSFPDRLGFDHIDMRFPLSRAREPFRRFLTDRPSDKPFFCQIGCDETHRPFDMHGTEPNDEKGIYVPPYLTDAPKTREELAAFQGLVNSFDRSLGTLFGELKEAGVWDQTIFVLTTDHGLAMPRSKCTLYDPGIETMLIGRVPGARSEAVCDELISNVDILPTLLELCGIDVPSWIAGKSFAGAFSGAVAQPRTHVFAEKTYHSLYDPLRCVRDKRFKYILHFEKIKYLEVPGDIRRRGAHQELSRDLDGPLTMEELFDLESNPVETENLIHSPEYRQIVNELRNELRGWLEATDDPILKGPIASPSYRRALDSLGAT